VLKRNGLNQLSRIARKRTVLIQRYEKQVLGHHIQMDVKFLKFKDPSGKKSNDIHIQPMMMPLAISL
jgi:hypothetical protein